MNIHSLASGDSGLSCDTPWMGDTAASCDAPIQAATPALERPTAS